MQAIKGLQHGQVRLAISEGYVDVLVHEVLAGFCERYPKLEVAIDMLTMEDLLAEVSEARAHISLAYNPPPHARVAWLASSPPPPRTCARAAVRDECRRNFGTILASSSCCADARRQEPAPRSNAAGANGWVGWRLPTRS